MSNTNFTLDGVNWNAAWVASNKSEKSFMATDPAKNAYLDKEPSAREALLKQVYLQAGGIPDKEDKQETKPKKS